MQWADANTSAYKVMKADEKEVLSAVKYTGEGKALLIYATEEAMQPREMDGKLPEPLKVCHVMYNECIEFKFRVSALSNNRVFVFFF